MELKTIFSEAKQSGVYRLDASFDLSNLQTLANKHDFLLLLIDGNKISSKADFLNQFEEALKPPEANDSWDAFEDNLEVTYHWIESRGLIIVYKDFQKFLVENKTDFGVALDIFQEVVKFRNKRAIYPQVTPLFVLLLGDTTADLSLDWLQ